jgi:hypothetical protein
MGVAEGLGVEEAGGRRVEYPLPPPVANRVYSPRMMNLS